MISVCPYCRELIKPDQLGALLLTRDGHNFFMFTCGECHTVLGFAPAPAGAAAAAPAESKIVTDPPLPGPLCPHHQLELIKKYAPPDSADAGQEFLICPRFSECHYYQPVQPALTPERSFAMLKALGQIPQGTAYRKIPLMSTKK